MMPIRVGGCSTEDEDCERASGVFVTRRRMDGTGGTSVTSYGCMESEPPRRRRLLNCRTSKIRDSGESYFEFELCFVKPSSALLPLLLSAEPARLGGLSVRQMKRAAAAGSVQ